MTPPPTFLNRKRPFSINENFSRVSVQRAGNENSGEMTERTDALFCRLSHGMLVRGASNRRCDFGITEVFIVHINAAIHAKFIRKFQGNEVNCGGVSPQWQIG